MNGVNVTLGIVGTPKKTVITDLTVAAFSPGIPYYGATSEVVCSNPTIGSIPGIYGAGEKIASDTLTYPMSGGTITIPNTHKAAPWAIPGANLFWSTTANASGNVGTPFTITDITQDASNTYIHTSLPDGLPTVPRGTGGALYAIAHPVPKLTFSNCTGSADADDFSRVPAGAPIRSYTKRTYSGAMDNSLTNQPYVQIWGNLISIKINVTKPDRSA